MKWEDTIMDLHGLNIGEISVANEQAEISFKLGKTAGVAESLIPALKGIEASRKAGRREVVEWIEAHTCGERLKIITKFLAISELDWQSKLKEWEIE